MKTDIRDLLTAMYDEHLHWLTIRVDCHPTLDQMTKFSLGLGAKKWLVGHEYKSSDVAHSHMVVGLTEKLTDYTKKNKIKEFFKIEKSAFSSSWVRTTVHRALCYSLKDDDFKQKGFDSDYLCKAILQSTKKFKKEEFRDALNELETLYYQDVILLREFTSMYLDIKIKQYGQRPNERSEVAYLNTHHYKKDIDFAKDYSAYIFSKLKIENNNLGYY